MTDVRGDLAHWLRAIKELKPQSDSELDAIARLLGLRLNAAEKRTAATPQRQKSKPEATTEAVAPSQFAARQINSGDRLEIVKIVAGG